MKMTLEKWIINKGGIIMKIQDFCKSVGNGGCLALCYIRAALGDKATSTMLFDALWSASENNIIDANDDCYVRDAISLMRLVFLHEEQHYL